MKFFIVVFILLFSSLLFSQSADSVSQGTKKQEVKKKNAKDVQNKNEKKSSEINTAAQDTVATKPFSKSAGYEKDMLRLIMIDASLELNEAMMEGVKATLDSLDKKNEKLMPFVLHIQDSLSKEIVLLKTEKREIETRIYSPTISIDTVTDGNDIVIYEVTTYPDERATERKLLTVITKMSNEIPKEETSTTKRINPSAAKDTVVVYDSPTENKPIEKTFAKYETARALDVRKDTSIALRIAVPNIDSAIVIKPITKPASSSSQKNYDTKTKPALNSSDSVKYILSELFFKRAQNAIREKKYPVAEENLLKAVGIYPKFFDAWFALAELRDQTGAHQQALKDYETCMKIDSTQPHLFFNIGNLYLKQKQKTEAMHYYNKTLALAPDFVPALAARASVLSDWKSYSIALNDYNHLLKIDRLYYAAYKERGLVKLLLKDFDSAVDDFTRFLIFEENDPSAYYYRGLAKIGNNEESDGCADLATSLKKGYAAAEKAIKKSCK